MRYALESGEERELPQDYQFDRKSCVALPERICRELEKRREAEALAVLKEVEMEEARMAKELEESQKVQPQANPASVLMTKPFGNTPSLPIFCAPDLRENIAKQKRGDAERAARQVPDLEAACAFDGQRALFSEPISNIKQELLALKEEMPNFSEVIDILTAELALALAGKPEDFRVTPICMNGVPGICKTRFAREVARILGVGFEQISMGAAGGGFELSGVNSGYGNSKSGRIFRLLAEGESACPVVLLDEIDKMAGDERFPPLPVVLDLLEPDTARGFRDEGLEVRCDASRMVFLLTSNDDSCIPEPLKSRVRLVEINPPTPQQRRGIAGRITASFKNLGLSFDGQALDALLAADMDLRTLGRVIREAAGRAIADGAIRVDMNYVTVPGKIERRIGFI